MDTPISTTCSPRSPMPCSSCAAIGHSVSHRRNGKPRRLSSSCAPVSRSWNLVHTSQLRLPTMNLGITPHLHVTYAPWRLYDRSNDHREAGLCALRRLPPDPDDRDRLCRAEYLRTAQCLARLT